MNNSGIYCIQNKYNGKVYIGSAVNLVSREKEHFTALKANRHVNKKLQNSYNKHGLGNFEWFILEYHKPIKFLLLQHEQFFMDTLDAVDSGYNICRFAGSSQGRKHSLETRKKMSKALKGRIISDDAKRKMSVSQKGKKQTEETKRKKSKSLKGLKRTDETRKNISLSKQNISTETRQKMSLAKQNISDETRRKMSESHIGKINPNAEKPFKIVSPLGELIEGKNLKRFCGENGLDQGHMHKVVNGKRKSHKGYRVYKEEINYE